MNKIYDIWFSELDINNLSKLKLLENNTSEQIWNLEFSDFVEFELPENDIMKILKSKNLDDAKRNFEYMQSKEIKIISVRDEKYSEKLMYIEDKPAFLYVRGNENILDEDNIGIVGCRNATNNGKTLTRAIAKNIADRNVNIVSGLAFGIDKYAHLGALDSELGKTIAVLGSSVADEKIYPYENAKVFQRILESGGAIISEYGIDARPEKKHFPARNRIISGLSDKVIVVEAKKRSGSLITANWAVEQGKDVFAVPGNILAKNSVGTNNLIKQGAYLFSSIDDIFWE